MDIHHSEQRLKNLLDRTRIDENIHDNNKIALIKFANYSIAQRLKATTISKDLTALRFLAVSLKKSFQSAQKEDVIRLMQKVERQNWTEKTKRSVRIVTKKFYRS